jgi:hypothetical protein
MTVAIRTSGRPDALQSGGNHDIRRHSLPFWIDRLRRRVACYELLVQRFRARGDVYTIRTWLHSRKCSPLINAMLDPVLALIGAAAAAIFWGIWWHKRKHREAVLDSAWREVLADPHYLERRHLEERRLVIKDAGRHHAGR